MCCFSQPVISVSATNIFARGGKDGRQFLAYSMTVNAETELAMVLPLPVKGGADEEAVRFIDLSGYPEFFADLRRGFPMPAGGSSFGCSRSVPPPSAAPLKVVSVGNFEASFVPTMNEVSRLDGRFRISDAAWKKLPQYRDYGFAVFKLKAGELKVHPMAFSFPRRDPKRLFFPTVHIHDGEVHAEADFDHVLYCQPREHEPLQVRDWRESPGNAGRFMKTSKTRGLISPEQHCYQKKLHGLLPNRDTLVDIAA